MTETPATPPVPTIDDNPDPGNEAGGTDAVPEEQTVPPLDTDVPHSAQVDVEDIPDEVKEPEEPDSEANVEDPSAEPSA